MTITLMMSMSEFVHHLSPFLDTICDTKDWCYETGSQKSDILVYQFRVGVNGGKGCDGEFHFLSKAEEPYKVKECQLYDGVYINKALKMKINHLSQALKVHYCIKIP